MNTIIILKSDEMSMIAEKDKLTDEDYEKIHSLSWDIQVTAERKLREMRGENKNGNNKIN